MSIGESAKFLAGLELSERDRMIAERVTQGDQRPARLPARRRPRLPVAVPLGRHAGRRRGPADPAGQPDRLRPRGHAVRARRAVDRAAPARQPAADRHADPAARPRQHGDRRRARRGDDPRGGLDRRHRPGRRRARRRRRLQRPGQRHHEGQGVADRAVPVGPQSIPVPETRRPPTRRLSSSSRGPASTTSTTSTSRSRSATSSPSPACPGSGKSTLVRDILLPVLMQRIYKSKIPAGKPPPDQRHRAARQGHRHGPVADRADAAVQPGDVHRRLRQHPQAVRLDQRGQGPRLHARPVQLQRQGRPLRGVRRRRHDQDRDALPARRLRAVRGVQGRPLQPGHARHRVQGQEHRRRARHAGGRGGRSSSPTSRRSPGTCRR